MQRDEKEEKREQSVYESLSADQLKKKERGKKYTLLHPDSPYYVRRKGAWRFIKEKTYFDNLSAFVYLKCKVHINISDHKLITMAWDTILPILIKYAKQIKSAKCLMIDEVKQKTFKAINTAKTHPFYQTEFPDVITYDSSKGIIYQREHPEKVKIINHLHATYHRYRHGAHILWYFISPTDQPLDMDLVKKILLEMEIALQKKGLKPAKTPDSDFPIDGLTFMSCRVDKNEEGEYMDFTEDKYAYVDNPVLQALVLPENLVRKPATEITVFYLPESRPLCDVMAEITKVTNPATESFWAKECKEDIRLMKLIMFIGKIADKTKEYTMTERTTKLITTVRTLRVFYLSLIKSPTHFKPVASGSIPILYIALLNLLFSDLDGLTLLGKLHKQIQKTVEPEQKSIFKP